MHCNTHDWSVAAVPDRVSFVVQSLHQSNFLVTWQVQLTTQIVNNITIFLISASSTDSWFPSPSLCSVL